MDNNNIDHAKLAEAISVTVLAAIKEQNPSVDSSVHKEHHEFIALIKKREERRAAFREAIVEKIAGSAVLTFLGSLLSVLGYAAISWLKQVKTGNGP